VERPQANTQSGLFLFLPKNVKPQNRRIVKPQTVKLNNMKRHHFSISILFAFSIAILFSCSNSDSTTGAEQFEIPELLVRNDAVANTIEWESRVNKVNASSAALIADPNDEDALLNLAVEFSKEARVTGEHGYYYPTVLMLADRALRQSDLTKDDRFMALLIKSHTLLSQHRFKDAESVALEAFQLNPYSADIYSALIDANVELGNYEAAADYAQKMVDRKPGLIAYARASYIREIYGDVDGAIWAMHQAVEAGVPGYDNTEWARTTLAQIYLNAGMRDSAITLYEASLSARPGYPFALAGLATAMRMEGDYDKAESLLKEALAAAPEIGFQEELFVLFSEQGRETDAEMAYVELLEMIEDDIAHGHRMDLEHARILLEFGSDVDGALTLAEKCYNRRPDNIEVNMLMAKISLELGKPDEAMEFYKKATRTGAKFPELTEIAQRLEDIN